MACRTLDRIHIHDETDTRRIRVEMAAGLPLNPLQTRREHYLAGIEMLHRLPTFRAGAANRQQE